MPSSDDVLATLPVLLLRARVAVAAMYNKRLRQLGLTEQQFRILLSLSVEDFADVTKLSRSCDLLPSSVSRILSNLDARDLLIRTPGRDDARRTLAIISPAGRQLVNETLADIHAIHVDIDTRVGEENAQELRIRLAALIGALASDQDDDEAAEGDSDQA